MGAVFFQSQLTTHSIRSRSRRLSDTRTAAQNHLSLLALSAIYFSRH
jgi:hypothetical protein